MQSSLSRIHARRAHRNTRKHRARKAHAYTGAPPSSSQPASQPTATLPVTFPQVNVVVICCEAIGTKSFEASCKDPDSNREWRKRRHSNNARAIDCQQAAVCQRSSGSAAHLDCLTHPDQPSDLQRMLSDFGNEHTTSWKANDLHGMARDYIGRDVRADQSREAAATPPPSEACSLALTVCWTLTASADKHQKSRPCQAFHFGGESVQAASATAFCPSDSAACLCAFNRMFDLVFSFSGVGNGSSMAGPDLWLDTTPCAHLSRTHTLSAQVLLPFTHEQLNKWCNSTLLKEQGTYLARPRALSQRPRRMVAQSRKPGLRRLWLA